MRVAGRNLNDTAQFDTHRIVPILLGAVAKLCVIVRAPRKQFARSSDRNRVGIAGVYRDDIRQRRQRSGNAWMSC